MKRIFSILLLQVFVLGFIFAASINSKQGYKGLAWGSSINDAKKAGYKLIQISAATDLYLEPVETYKATVNDKSVSTLQLHYYNGKLFHAIETLSSNNFSRQKLESRYGNFSKQGIYMAGQQYTDATRENDGSVSNLSIIISNSSGKIIAKLYDWNIYKKISVAGQKLSQGQKIKSSTPIVARLQNLADEIVTDMVEKRGGTDKPTLAILPLSTDYGNIYVEDYVVDSLAEAIHNTDKIRLYERSHLERILAELNFQETKYIDQRAAKQVGDFVGVDYVCYGTIKDTGERLIVKACVVTVKTAEFCAIRSADVIKDEYLKGQPQKAVGSRNTALNATAAKKMPEDASAHVKKTTTASNSAWKVTTYNDDFGGAKVYVFTVNSSDSRLLFIRYQKADNLANSKVVAGIHWTEHDGWVTGTRYESNDGIYDIKGVNGTISERLSDISKCFLNSSENNYFLYTWNQKKGARWLVDIIRKSDSVAVRRDGLSRRFQTAGLLDKMAEYGITWAEINTALTNEEF